MSSCCTSTTEGLPSLGGLSNVKCSPLAFFGGIGILKNRLHGPSSRCSCAESSKSGYAKEDEPADASEGVDAVRRANVFEGDVGRMGKSGMAC